MKFDGHFNQAKAKSERVFSLEIRQTGHQAKVSFFTAMMNHAGPASFGSGNGSVEGDKLTFVFKDNFNNEGTGVLEYRSEGCHLNVTLTQVTDASFTRFYENILLEKTK